MVCCPVLSSACRPGNYCNCDQWQLWLRSLATLLQTLVQLWQSARKSGMGFVLHSLSSLLCLTDKLSTKHASVLPVSFLPLCLSPTKYFSFSLTAISTRTLVQPPHPHAPQCLARNKTKSLMQKIQSCIHVTEWTFENVCKCLSQRNTS